MRATTTRSRAVRRLAVAAAISVGAVVVALGIPSGSISALSGGQADGYKKAYAAKAKTARSAAKGSGTIFAADGSHEHLSGEHRRALAQPQRPAHEERRLPGRADHQPRDRRPHHTGPGPSCGRRRGGAAVPDRAEALQRPGERDAHLLADEPLQHVQRLLRNPVDPVEPLARRRHHADLHRGHDRRRSPALLQAHRARPLPALQPHEDLPQRRPAGRQLLRRARPQQQLGRHDAEAGTLPVPDPRQGLPDRHRHQGHRHEHRDALPAPPAQRLHQLPRDRHQRHRQPVLGRERHPGGPRLHRRAHPRNGLRVPRRTGALRAALVAVRRGEGVEGLPGPRGNRGQGRGDGGVPVQEEHPRPGRLADLQGLARSGVADPRGHLLQVDGALLALRPAAPGEPAGREQQAVRALPAQAQLLQRHGLDPPAGKADAQLRELHRRAARRSRQGLVPHRHEPGPGSPYDQRRQDGRGDGHRDLGPVRLHPEARCPGPALLEGLDRPAARRGPQARRLADGAGQQVRQRPVRRRR